MTNYLTLMWKTAGNLSKRTGLSKGFLMWDAFWAYVKHGYSIREYNLGKGYALRNFQKKNVVTYRRWMEIRRTFNDPNYEHFLEDKVDFNTLFSDFIHRKWIGTKNHTTDEVKRFIDKNAPVILKPIAEMQGKGIQILASSENYTEEAGQEYIIEELIKRHPQMVFNNSSVNTIRAYTVLDGNGEAHIIKTLLRVGKGNAIVDNVHAGGVLYPVNDETGRIEGPGLNPDYDTEFLVHPGSNIVMLGHQIPQWDELCVQVKEAAKLLPQVRFIGWDITVTPGGIDFIEGNHNPDLELLEFIGKTGFYNKIMDLK